MIFGQDRNELRQMYAGAWQKRVAGKVLSPLEDQIARVIEEHPEYHATVTGDLDKDFNVEGGQTNPFLHMGLHLGIREQVATNRPAGIAAAFKALADKSLVLVDVDFPRKSELPAELKEQGKVYWNPKMVRQ